MSDCDDENTWKFLDDRSRVCRYLQKITERGNRSFDPKSTPGWGNHVNVGGPQGKQRGKQRPRVLDYESGLEEARNYLGQGLSKRGHYVRTAGRWHRGRLFWLARKGSDKPQDDDHQQDMAVSKA